MHSCATHSTAAGVMECTSVPTSRCHCRPSSRMPAMHPGSRSTLHFRSEFAVQTWASVARRQGQCASLAAALRGALQCIALKLCTPAPSACKASLLYTARTGAMCTGSGSPCRYTSIQNKIAPEHHSQDDAQHVVLQRDAGTRTAQPPCPGALQHNENGLWTCQRRVGLIV